MSSPPPRLRPGLHVLRRDAASVQVGLDAPHRLILPADERCLALLEALRHGVQSGPWDDVESRIVHDLRLAGLLDEHPAPPPRPHVVGLHDRELPGAAEQLTDLLQAAGDVVVSDDPGPDLVVALAAAPLPRTVVDPWLADGTVHLVVAGTGYPGGLRIGPLVEPGVTACVRCVDAAESERDPRRPLLLEQLATRTPGPLEPAVLALAVAWAARDVLGFLARRQATTWSATVDLGGGVPLVRRWPRHPECGCCWDDLPY